MIGLFLRLMESPIVRRLPWWLLAPLANIAIRKAKRGMPPAIIAQAREVGLITLAEALRPYIEDEVGKGIDPMEEIMRGLETPIKYILGDKLGITEEDLRRVIENEIALAQHKLQDEVNTS